MIAAVIDRTTKTEGQLAEATAQAQRLREELSAARDEASRDHLTGLANRGATEERLLELRETDQPLGRVTFSAGIASSRGRSAEQLIAAADALLYQAKSQGRNRTIGEAPVVGV